MVRGVAPCGCDGADERVGDKGDADADRMRKEGCQDEASATDEPLEGDAGGEQGEGPYQGAEAGRARPGGQQTPQAQRMGEVGRKRVAQDMQRRGVADSGQYCRAEHEESRECGGDASAAQPGEGGAGTGGHARR